MQTTLRLLKWLGVAFLAGFIAGYFVNNAIWEKRISHPVSDTTHTFIPQKPDSGIVPSVIKPPKPKPPLIMPKPIDNRDSVYVAVIDSLQDRITFLERERVVTLKTPAIGELVLHIVPLANSDSVWYHHQPPPKEQTTVDNTIYVKTFSIVDAVIVAGGTALAILVLSKH